MKNYVGRPSPLFLAERLTEMAGGAAIYLKREDLNHTGAHKINNAIGQVLLAQRMGKTRVIAETGAGQHGVATATACALFGLECTVYMGEEDIRRQKLNVFNMRTLGADGRARSRPARGPSATPPTRRCATGWDRRKETHYTIGSVVGPHPFPMIVRDFQSVIGRETRQQCLERLGRLPDAVVACVGGGSNAAGMFYPFIDDAEVELVGAEAGGRGLKAGEHAVQPHAGQARRAPRQLQLRAPGRRRPDPGRPLDLGRPRLPGRRPRAQLLEGPAAASATRASPTPRPSTPTTPPPARRHPARPRIEPRPGPGVQGSPPPRRPARSLVVCLSGRGDKDAYEVARLRGEPICDG